MRCIFISTAEIGHRSRSKRVPCLCNAARSVVRFGALDCVGEWRSSSLMLTMVYRTLALAFVAVLFAGTAQAHSVAPDPSNVRAHGAATAGGDGEPSAGIMTVSQAEIRADHDCGGGSHPGNSCCPGVHAHCCVASAAILNRDTAFQPTPSRRAWGSFEAALRFGQQSYPPRRPPRIAA
jgi:hypothetical protein